VSWRRAALALVFVWFAAGGLGHFFLTAAFTSVVPAYVPHPREMVLATGVFEIAGALALLVKRLRPFAGIGLIVLTVCVTPVHVDMLLNAERHPIGEPALWARLLFQPIFVFIIWFATLARPSGHTSR